MNQNKSLQAAKLIRGNSSTNVQNGIKLYNELIDSAFPLDFEETNYNMGLGYYRLGDVEELKFLRTQNPNNARLTRLFYYLENDEIPNGQNGLIMSKHNRNQTFIVRNCGLLLAGGTLLAAFCLLD